MTMAFVAIIVLIVYSAWMTYNWVSAKSSAVYTRSELDVARARVHSLSLDIMKQAESYETRLAANREALNAYRDKFIGNGGHAFNIDGSLSTEGPTPPLGTTIADPTK